MRIEISPFRAPSPEALATEIVERRGTTHGPAAVDTDKK
jgi:hypothetical protein